MGIEYLTQAGSLFNEGGATLTLVEAGRTQRSDVPSTTRQLTLPVKWDA